MPKWKTTQIQSIISEKLPSCNSTLPFSRSSYRTDGHRWLYILFDLISSSIAARFQVKTLIEPRASCKCIIKQKKTKNNTVTDDSTIENKRPSEREYNCEEGYKKYTYGQVFFTNATNASTWIPINLNLLSDCRHLPVSICLVIVFVT